ncbi:hypothetical protein N9I65_00145 [bacterium]|nr:hypothetical protein [bacterium]
MKVVVRMLLVAVMAPGGPGGYSMTVGKDTIVGIQTQQVIAKIQNPAGGKLPALKWLKPNEDTGEDMKTYEPVLRACLDTMLFESDGHHFSQSK